MNENTDIEKQYFGSINFLFKHLSKILSSVLGFSLIAYVLGWLHVKSYFGTFGATWIMNDISPISILGFSWYSITAIIWVFFFGFLDISESKNRWKSSNFILKYGWIFLGVIIISQIITSKYNLLTVSGILSIVLGVSYILYAGAAFESLVVRLKNQNLKWDLGSTYLIFVILIFGFYYAPTNIGSRNAKIDLDVEKTTLPIVHVFSNHSKSYRLLYLNNDNYYLVKLDSLKTYPKIFIKHSKDIYFIQNKK